MDFIIIVLLGVFVYIGHNVIERIELQGFYRNLLLNLEDAHKVNSYLYLCRLSEQYPTRFKKHLRKELRDIPHNHSSMLDTVTPYQKESVVSYNVVDYYQSVWESDDFENRKQFIMKILKNL